MERTQPKGQDLIQSLGGVVFNLDWEFRNKLIDVLRDASDLFYGDTLDELQRSRLTEQYNDLITVLLNLARKDKITVRSFNCFDFGYEQRGNLILCLADDCFGALYFERLGEQLRSELVEKNENQILILSSLKWQELDESDELQPVSVDLVETIMNEPPTEKAEDSESVKEDAKSVKSEKSGKSHKSVKSETVKSGEEKLSPKLNRPAKSERSTAEKPTTTGRSTEKVAKGLPRAGAQTTKQEKKPDERRKHSTDDSNLTSQSTTDIPISVHQHPVSIEPESSFPRVVKAVDENYLREKLTKIEEALPRLQKIRKLNEFPYYEPIKIEPAVKIEPTDAPKWEAVDEPLKKEKLKNLNEQVSSLSDDIRNLKLQISQLKGGSQSMNNLSYESTTIKKYKVKTTERYLFGLPY